MTEQTTQPAEDLKYGGLNNKELLLVYYKMKDFVTNLEDNLNKHKVQKVIDTPMGRGVAYMDIPVEHVEKFKSTEYYKTMHDVLSKLQPVVEVIEDCDAGCKAFADELR